MTYRAAVLVIHSYLCKISPLYEIAVFWYYRLFLSLPLVYLLPLSYHMFYSCNSTLYDCTSTVIITFGCMLYFVINITFYNIPFSLVFIHSFYHSFIDSASHPIQYYHSILYSAKQYSLTLYSLSIGTIFSPLHYTFTIYVVTFDTLY